MPNARRIRYRDLLNRPNSDGLAGRIGTLESALAAASARAEAIANAANAAIALVLEEHARLATQIGHLNTDITNLESIVASQTITLNDHGTRHENGGTDEISVAGLSGLLADAQTPLAHTHFATDIIEAVYAPSSVATVTGTLDSGTIASLLTGGDSNVYSVSEVTGTPGFDIQITFGAVTGAFNHLVWTGYYRGNPAHEVKLYLWNYGTAAWNELATIASDTAAASYSYSVVDSSPYISGTESKVRFIHNSAGNATHDIFIDFIALHYAIGGGVDTHNDLGGLQGGTAGEYYHLTAAEYAALGSSGGATMGTATISFGAFPGANEASVAVTGQTAILGTSKVDAFIMADDTTADHTASDHRYADALIGLTCGSLIAGTGFTIRATSLEKLQGTFAVRWRWQ
jgi:hypothetical protein